MGFEMTLHAGTMQLTVANHRSFDERLASDIRATSTSSARRILDISRGKDKGRSQRLIVVCNEMRMRRGRSLDIVKRLLPKPMSREVEFDRVRTAIFA